MSFSAVKSSKTLISGCYIVFLYFLILKIKLQINCLDIEYQNNLRIAKHLTYYWALGQNVHSRLHFINEIIRNLQTYDFPTDLFIHTNRLFNKKLLVTNLNGNVSLIHHPLTNLTIHHSKKYLPWRCRELIKDQVLSDVYDIYIYIEDDILIPWVAIFKYWLKYKDICIKNRYNLGFIRVEPDENNILLAIDFSKKLNRTHNINLDNITYVINDKNPYCAFWIYDKKEMNNWIQTELFNPLKITGYEIREASAVGLHGKFTDWYHATIIPMFQGEKKLMLTNECKVFHLANNYHNISRLVFNGNLLE